MSKRQIGGVFFGVLILAVAVPLLVLALLHGADGTARAQEPPDTYEKVSMPDFGQHSKNWCWVAAAANSLWWYSEHDWPELVPQAYREIDDFSRDPGNLPGHPDVNGDTVPDWFDYNDRPEGTGAVYDGTCGNYLDDEAIPDGQVDFVPPPWPPGIPADPDCTSPFLGGGPPAGDDDADGSIDEDPIDGGVDEDGDSTADEDPINGRDDDGDTLVDEDPPAVDDDNDGRFDEDGVVGYRTLLRKIAEATWHDSNNDGIRDPDEKNYVYSEPVEKWDYLLGLQAYINAHPTASPGLSVHDILHPNYTGDYLIEDGSARIWDRPGQLTDTAKTNSGVVQKIETPTLADYKRELSRSQDVLVWMCRWVQFDEQQTLTCHVVTGQAYDTSAGVGAYGNGVITVSDPWTHDAAAHDDTWLAGGGSGPFGNDAPDHNNDPKHDPDPYDDCDVVTVGNKLDPPDDEDFELDCNGRTWTVIDLIFVSPPDNTDLKIVDWTAPTPLDIPMGGGQVIPVNEVKHNNGPLSAFSRVTWTAIAPSEVYVNWQAEPGDNQPSANMLEFEVDLTAVSVSLDLERDLELICVGTDPGRYVVTLINEEWPFDPDSGLDLEDLAPDNNVAYTDVIVTCGALGAGTVDKAVTDVVFDDAGAYPEEGAELEPPNEFTVLKDTNVPFSVTSVEINNGPTVPLDAEVSFYADIPLTCKGRWVPDPVTFPADLHTRYGNPNVGSSGTVVPLDTPKEYGDDDPSTFEADLHFQTAEYGITEPVGQPLRFTRFFELHCYNAGDYTFNICNRIDVKAPDVDPNPDNNLRCEPITVHVLHNSDIKVNTFYSDPEPPFEFTVSENNVITLIEDKHNNGPQDALVDVSWWVDPVPDRNEDGIPDINVRWEALTGDLCTSGGLSVACGEGDGPGTGGSGDGYPSITGDNCQDGQDNDQDGLYDFDDPDCLWELDDLHFQIPLEVSTTTAVDRGLKLHCKVPGDYTIRLNNDEWPVEAEDPDPSNNFRILDLPITCTAATATADKEVIDVELRDPTGQPIDPPEMTILKSQDYTISVTSDEFNNGPDQPFDAEISFFANIPNGCQGQWVLDPANYADVLTIDGNPSVGSSGTPTTPGMVDGLRTVDLHFQTLEYGIDEPPQGTLAFTRDFQLHCLEASPASYVFTFCNRADVKAPDVDPYPDNNLYCEDLFVTSLHNADIKVLSWSAPSPVSGQVGVPFVITADEEKHNNGPQDASSDVTWTATAPAEVTAVWVDSGTSVLNFTVGPISVDTTLPLSRDLQLTCNAAGGPYTVTLDTAEQPVDPSTGELWVDPVPGNNNATTNVLVNCTEGGGEVKWGQMPDESPLGLDVSAYPPFVLADDFQCNESGLITEIDFWASWFGDAPPMGDPNLVAFTLSLHSDVPAGVDQDWSHPGEMLWMQMFEPYQCMVQPWGVGEEGWFQPPEDYIPFADNQIWFYTCPIPEPYWFQQKEGTVYWLDVQAFPMDSAFFGWKTSIDHFNDDGVWSMGEEPIEPLSWSELRYPLGHPQFPQSIDLAFQMLGQECPAGVDTDFDGFNDDVECYLTTDRLDDCTNNPGVHDAWPLDMNMDTFVTMADVNRYYGRLGSTGGPPASPNWLKRLDLNMDNFITMADVNKYYGKLGSKCT